MSKKSKVQNSPYVEADVTGQVTRELPILIKETDSGYFDYVDKKNVDYTYAFHQIYNRADETVDKEFQKEIRRRFSMCDIEYRSCVSEATALRISEEVLNEIRDEEIEELKTMYADEDATPDKRFKILNKIASLKRQHTQNAVFGGRSALKALTKAYNRISEAEMNIPRLYNEIEELEAKLQDKEISKRDFKRTKYIINVKKQRINQLRERSNNASKRIPKLKKELQESRIMDTFLMGEANRKGNRFVDFDLKNGKLTLKITGNEKYDIYVKIPKKFEEQLRTVQELIDRKEISVSVHINRKYIKLSYDIAVVNGYSLDRKTLRKEVKEIKSYNYPEEIEKEKIKESYKNQYNIQKEKMLEGKIEGRSVNIDLNPGDIGYCVLQKDDTAEEGYRIIAAGRLSWKSLMNKDGTASSSAKAKRMNNKRKNAVALALKLLFNIAIHYKCSEFIMEDLDFSDTDVSDKSRESNRKCKNIWYRELSEKIINRRCVENGIRLIKTNACHTSFMGNIKHDFCDSTNASVEIGRRGLLRYNGGSFYPQMTMRDRDTMTRVAASGDKGDAHDFTCESWKTAYKSCRNCYTKKADFEHRYRTALGESP